MPPAGYSKIFDVSKMTLYGRGNQKRLKLVDFRLVGDFVHGYWESLEARQDSKKGRRITLILPFLLYNRCNKIAKSEQEVKKILKGEPDYAVLKQFNFSLEAFDAKTRRLQKLERESKTTAAVSSKSDQSNYASSDDCFTKNITPKAKGRKMRQRLAAKLSKRVKVQIDEQQETIP
ncbi:hypothetical protein DAPPUDRAFT_116844 [Daphnia pulex]|uniref:Uncharacterized protein n=1 Tax=Daphnia pulex TaxID=6669 RepID=E9HQQ1_DAPPU|nr:hypothetical protein DAPPUDRAFT_116844 [Daphnia pulex]|eukprot:EFX65934.1 hypothetical protein DAPPUDRAFT_116844 [Daphnia pulex]